MRTLLLMSATIILTYVTIGHSFVAFAENGEDIIKQVNVDVNGDGHSQSVMLMGERLDDNSSYYRDVWLEVSNLSNNNPLHYGGGYEPTLQIVHDENATRPLIIFKSNTQSDGATAYTAHFYSKTKQKLKQVPMPELQYVKAEIKDQYIIKIKTAPTVQPINADFSSAPSDIKDKLFDQNGDADQSASLHVSPNTDYKVQSLDNQSLVNSFTSVHAFDENGMVIGHIHTKWSYSDGKWINTHTEWKHLF